MSVNGVLSVMDALEWGFSHRRCPLCVGWDPKGNGETDKKHTADCPFPTARAAMADMLECVKHVVNYDGDPRFPDAVLADNRKMLAKRLIACQGESE